MRSRRNTPVGRAENQAATRKARFLDRVACLKAYGGDPPRCACCGESNLGFLTLDHANNDGAEHRRSLAKVRGWTYWRKLIGLGFPSYPPLQVLCYNCNLGRHNNRGVCPHHGYNPVPTSRKIADVIVATAPAGDVEGDHV